MRKIATVSFTGSAIEWYDFFLYGTAAALVFGQLFFPSFDPLVGTIAAFGTFAVGFISRIIGAILIGHYGGDKIGRGAGLKGPFLPSHRPSMTALLGKVATTIL